MIPPRPRRRRAGLPFGALLALLCGLTLLTGPTAAVVPFAIDGDSPSTDLQAHTTYLLAPDGERELAEFRDRLDWQPLLHTNLGYLTHPVWSRIELHNVDERPRHVLLYKTRPGITEIDAHLVRGDGRVETRLIGLRRPMENQALWHRYPTIDVALAPGEGVTLYTRVRSPGPTEATWQFSPVNEFAARSTVEHLLWGVFSGAVLTMVMYNLMLWFSLRQRILLAYTAFGSLLLLSALSVQGFYRLYDFGIPPTWFLHASWVFSLLMSAAMVVLAMTFFDTRRSMPRMHRALQLLVATCGGALVWVAAAIIHEGLFRFTPLMYYLFLTIYISVVVTAVLGIRQRVVGSAYYLAGQGSMLLATLLLLLVLLGVITHPLVTLLLFPLGALLDITFLAKAISLRIGMLKRELERQRESTLAQSRFASLGKTIGMVTHQWRTPLARQGAALTELEVALSQGDDPATLERLRQVLLPRLQENLRRLDATVTDFRAFFAADTQTQRFLPADTVDETIALLAWQALPEEVTVDWQRPAEDLEVDGHPATLAHVLMILMENALDIFDERKVDEPRLGIDLSADGDEVVLCISDNGGGIELRPVERVFATFVSGKRRESCGMGLYVARMLVMERLRGRLEAGNDGNGARFTIRLPRADGLRAEGALRPCRSA